MRAVVKNLLPGRVVELRQRLNQRLASELPEKLVPYPELRDSDMAEGARLFATREGLVRYIAPKMQGCAIAEVGVLYGDFTAVMLDAFRPRLFVAIDNFSVTDGCGWNKTTAADRFRGRSHRKYFEDRFSDHPEMQIRQGLSWDMLAEYPDGAFDFLYLDAAHDVPSVRRDAAIARAKVKVGGILIFNDYMRFSHYDDTYYGTVPAANDLIVHHGFQVEGFALQHEMYCDLAVRRVT